MAELQQTGDQMGDNAIIPAGPTEEDKEILGELRALCGDALRELAIRVGGFVFQRFFDSSDEALGSHAPNKYDRLSGFAARAGEFLEELGLPERTLLHYARIYTVYRKLPPPVQSVLDPSHYVELHRITAPIACTQLALKAADEKMSVRQLRDAVDAWRAENLAPKGHGGRPKLPEPVRVWGAVTRLVEGVAEDGDEVGALSAEQKAGLLGQLAAVEAKIRRVRVAIEGAGS